SELAPYVELLADDLDPRGERVEAAVDRDRVFEVRKASCLEDVARAGAEPLLPADDLPVEDHALRLVRELHRRPVRQRDDEERSFEADAARGDVDELAASGGQA